MTWIAPKGGRVKPAPAILCLFFMVLIFGCGSQTPPPPFQPNPGGMLFSDSFDNAAFSGWTKSNDPASLVPPPQYAIGTVHSPTRLSNSAVRFELHRDDPAVYGGKRAELRILPPDQQFAERWFAFSIYLPEDYADDPGSAEILAQWHNYPDMEKGEGWTSPPLALLTWNGKWALNGVWDENQISTMDEIWYGKKHYEADFGSYHDDRGKWTDWVVHVKWGWLPEHDPFVDVYKNGQLIFGRKGPNTTNDKNGVYFNIGIYKWDRRCALQPARLFSDTMTVKGQLISWEKP
ncbi:MAG: hypothetical protein EHM28_04730 [Spirochaetaceae bacterium]|nr:MAG: hypothetical protein EHM28_04730 [Spirochaetaceae bacterium]